MAKPKVRTENIYTSDMVRTVRAGSNDPDPRPNGDGPISSGGARTFRQDDGRGPSTRGPGGARYLSGGRQRNPEKGSNANKNTNPARKGRTYGQPREDWRDQLQGEDRNAAGALIALFKSYGLESLAPLIVRAIKNGESSDTIYLQLQESDAWKKRFAGNVARQNAGLPVLSPADYLSIESSYRQVLQQAGFPKGFYDDPSDFAKWIGGDTSPQEVQERAQMYTQFALQQTDPATRQALARYGMGVGDLAAFYMNKSRALPLLQRRSQQVATAAAAIKTGLGDITNSQIDRLVSDGVSPEQAQQGFSQIGQTLPGLSNAADVWGSSYSLSDALADTFEGDASAANRRRRLASQERAAFSGQSSLSNQRSNRGNY